MRLPTSYLPDRLFEPLPVSFLTAIEPKIISTLVYLATDLTLVVIQISDNEQIGTVISLIKTQLEEKNEYTIEKHKEEARNKLHELEVKDEEIDVWLSYIE